jgi:hypothetical protein
MSVHVHNTAQVVRPVSFVFPNLASLPVRVIPRYHTYNTVPLSRTSLPMSSVTIEPAKKQSRSKVKEKRQGQSTTKASGAERLKTVVRRLPANLPEPIFWQSVQTWVTDDSVIFKEYWPGKVKKK